MIKAVNYILYPFRPKFKKKRCSGSRAEVFNSVASGWREYRVLFLRLHTVRTYSSTDKV